MSMNEDPSPITPSSEENGNGGSNPRLYPSPVAEYDQVASDSELFYHTLRAFHQSFGSNFNVPTVGGRALDLYRLFVEVTSRGGIEKVIKDHKWKEVTVVFNFPSTITSASFVLRKYYLSLLYHYEQAYYFREEGPLISLPDLLSKSTINGSAALHAAEESAVANQLPASLELQPGGLVDGAIDAKFDNGYMVSVGLGAEKLRGVLYHIPTASDTSQSNNSVNPPQRKRKRKKSHLALKDSSRPEPNSRGYKLFFEKHYTMLEPLHYGYDKDIKERIQALWNKLSEAEKKVYEEKELRDEDRHRNRSANVAVS
ncbi:ARID DNA-binding domain [Dillenia turbinata]|uniref:ARID DNA-binding domain n=1 Tax=Dillenia turbinata TaxID=194707 RepID=A0AAN8VV58_9MAGN